MSASAAAGMVGDSGWTLAAATLVVAGLLLVPGWIVGRSAHLGALPSLAVAPALGSANIGAAEILAHALALPWRPWGWAVIAALTAVSALMARLIAGSPPERARRTAPQGWAERTILAGGLIVAVVVPAGAILSVLPGPAYPAQAFDATFHLNAVAAIREGGNASMLGGLSALYSGRAVYYPTVWHGALALAPGGPVPVSTAGVLALTAVAWPLSLLGLLARAAGLDTPWEPEAEGARRRQQTCAVAAVLALSAAVVGFPLLPMTSLAVWPYALSVLGLPGVLVLYDLLRRGTASRRLRLVLVLLALAAAGGVVAAHGTGLFNLAVLTPPFLADAVVSLWRRSATRRGGRALLAAVAVAAMLVLAAGTWFMRGSLASVLGYRRPAGGVAGAVATLGQAIIDLPMYGAVPGATVPIGIVIGLLTLAAAWSARSRRDQRPWLIMWLLALLLLVLVGGPQWVGRQLGAPWYLQKARILPLAILPAFVLLVQAGAGQPGRRLWEVLCRAASQVGGMRPERAAAAMLVALVLLPVAARTPLERNLAASVYDPQRIQYGTLLTKDSIALIRRSRSELPDDAVVLGAPSRGAAHLWSLGGLHVVYPTRDKTAPGTPGAALASAWPTLGQKGSQTCTLLNRLGVRYFYSSSDATASGSVTGAAPLRWDSRLTQVPSEGLELVDSEGSASLWRITACD
ncbi:hypothetical protein BKH34_00780 [Actinomyces naeslundii]|uniref:DUF6541 family protein n=1 Tax=Actinomyces naeslundii TaxID=1655 RepID=UPI00096EBBF7|nr:DUF6541 family protein [Actinomyces naeslundii]OMG34238.1 hypothetical protein BKH34_00780 [Actinomyces naeslundii]